ncbi:MAG: hypothetical protein KGZ97_06385 [Bacteroidetes bacterium]|nr:hypothetical protein [Bacteroidota bacterium]
MFNKDSWVLGAIIGIILPAAAFGLVYLILGISGIDNTNAITSAGKYFKLSNILLISIFTNMLPFRIYMVNKKYDKTGRGILGATIIYAILFFILFL